MLNPEGVADYLHLTPADVEQRVKCREIPFEKRGHRVLFRRGDIEDWASKRIMNFPPEKLAVYHGKSTRHTQKILQNQAILPKMLEAGTVAADMPSKTRASILCDLVTLADKTGLLCDAHSLLDGLKSREELCSTAMPGGLALPHPRFHDSFLFESSFIVVGRTIQEIHFGAPDGQPTRLFFLLCSKNDPLHLHMLARLCVITKKENLIEQLLEAPNAEAIQKLLIETEQEVLEDWKADPNV